MENLRLSELLSSGHAKLLLYLFEERQIGHLFNGDLAV